MYTIYGYLSTFKLPLHDHSFLTYKKELLEYGYKVGKISMKNKTVEFIKGDSN